jgi:hypothetical protein
MVLALTHVDVPVEWIEDMTMIWTAKLDQRTYQSTPKTKCRR